MKTSRLSAGDVFDELTSPLSLEWIAGRQGRQRKLFTGSSGDGDDTERLLGALVGHMNLIYPNRIQVLGQEALRYLAGLGKNSLADTQRYLFSTGPFMVIVAGEIPVSEALMALSDEYGVPLLRSSLSASVLISKLRHQLARDLAETFSVHGVFMEVLGIGVLITGESGVGKSELALDLISRNHRLVADDVPEFQQVAPGVIRGACPELLIGFLEVRGLGLLNIREMFGESAIKSAKRLGLILHLKRMPPEILAKIDRLRGIRTRQEVAGVAIDQVTLPVAPGHNMAVLAEGAIRNFMLLEKGYDSVAHFSELQSSLIERQSS